MISAGVLKEELIIHRKGSSVKNAPISSTAYFRMLAAMAAGLRDFIRQPPCPG